MSFFQELGLKTHFSKKMVVYEFIKKFMALPYLPSEEIQAMFESIASKLTKDSLKVIFYYSTYKL